MFSNSNSVAQSYFSTKNLILKSLPEDVRLRLLSNLEVVNLKAGQVLYRAEKKIQHVYFPDNGIVSIVAMTTDGQSVEIGVIGYEGLVGMDVLLGCDASPYEIIVRHPDNALRISVAAIKGEFKTNGILHDRLLRYERLAFMQAGQMALCNRFHTLLERLAKWLLLYNDRVKDGQLKVTQEFLAVMLGTSRPSVTTSAIVLQSAGCIKYTRGSLIVIDREGLETFTCDCYQMVEREYDRYQRQAAQEIFGIRRQTSELYANYSC